MSKSVIHCMSDSIFYCNGSGQNTISFSSRYSFYNKIIYGINRLAQVIAEKFKNI